MQFGFDVGAARDQQSKVVDPRLEADVVVFDFAGPISSDGKLDADAGHPAEVKQRRRCERVAVHVVDDDLGLAESDSAGNVRQDRTEGETGARPRGCKIIVRRMVRRECDRRVVVRGDKSHIAFEAEHEAVRILDIEPGLVAANDARHAVPEKFALRGQGNGGGPKTAAPVAEVKTDIDAAPVIGIG